MLPVNCRPWICAAALAWAALGGASTGQAQQGETLYGALIMASNAEPAGPPPPELVPEWENLRGVFGYSQFVVLGQKRKPIVDGTEDWLVSSAKFFLRVDTKSPIPGGYALGLQLYRDKHVFAEAQVKLKRDNPLFIRGPMTSKGQLVILLMIQ